MNRFNNIGAFLLIAVFVITLSACSNPGGDNPGTEYMPDMGHSIAYEANYYDYYSKNTWGTEADYYELAQPRKPVKGTIPRGYAGNVAPSSRDVAIPPNGSVPYHYEDTEEERNRAMAEIVNNPYPITAEGLARGKELYDIYCGICHGEKGDGNGYLVAEDNLNVKYPAQPAIFTTDEFVNASEGRYYHSIIYGKNVMGGYADKLSYEERWQVIHHIRSLQAKDRKLAYNETENTLNEIGVPGATLPSHSMASHVVKVTVPKLKHHGGGHSNENHGHGDGHSDENHESGEHHSDDSHSEVEGGH